MVGKVAVDSRPPPPRCRWRTGAAAGARPPATGSWRSRRCRSGRSCRCTTVGAPPIRCSRRGPCASRADQRSRKPGERPAPRESTRTQAYPSGTHFSGSTTSQFWYLLVEPAGTSGCLLDHPPPLICVEVFEKQILSIWAVGQNYGIRALGNRSVDVGAQDEPVVHGDRHVPVDPHSVANLAPVGAHDAPHGGGVPASAWERRRGLDRCLQCSTRTGHPALTDSTIAASTATLAVPSSPPTSGRVPSRTQRANSASSSAIQSVRCSGTGDRSASPFFCRNRREPSASLNAWASVP